MSPTSECCDHFWNQWKHEYLFEVHRCTQGSSVTPPVSVGDIVLMHNDGPRGFWKLARVEKLIAGKDGHTRGAAIRVSANNGQTTGRMGFIAFAPGLRQYYPIQPSWVWYN